MATLGTGGIGKMRVHLTRELAQRGIKVDLLLGKITGPYVSAVDPRVRIIKMGTSHALMSLPRLIAYLRHERPTALITEKLRVNIAALRARRLARVNTLVFTSVHGVVSHKLDKENLKQSKQQAKMAAICRYYPLNDGFITVSKGIAEDLINVFGVPERKIHVVYNPVVTPELILRSKEAANHPWLDSDGPAVILSTGRLEPQKDYPILIQAFAKMRAKRECRLIILGEGKERSKLESLVETLNIQEYVSFSGFVPNPYVYMAKADLFVLSSAWEGFGNVLVEAMACGLPVVATDCPSGPREILQNGLYGPLVPVGNVDALARAMEATLDKPISPQRLKTAAQYYSATACTDGYLRALGLK